MSSDNFAANICQSHAKSWQRLVIFATKVQNNIENSKAFPQKSSIFLRKHLSAVVMAQTLLQDSGLSDFGLSDFLMFFSVRRGKEA